VNENRRFEVNCALSKHEMDNKSMFENMLFRRCGKSLNCRVWSYVCVSNVWLIIGKG